RLVAALNQPQYQPWPVEDQVAVMYAANQGYLDRIDVSEVPKMNQAIRDTLAEEGTILASIRDSKELSDDTAAALDAVLEKIAGQFAPVEPVVEAEAAATA
ncbi:MAG: F0F1 ATP synthase subunit alpha, partial [Dehalococcoidia bacterium]|nr:F0F1 ATP synthase subunit alpha [Dehalococcoidia bacterium]